MKRLLMIALGSAVSFSAFAASTNIDEKFFVAPHVALAEKTSVIALNVGSSLPSTMHIVSKDGCKVQGLGTHLSELASQLNANGKAVIAAPASYGVVFTDGSYSEQQVKDRIVQVLTKIGTNQDSKVIVDNLNSLTDVHRATFVTRNNHLVLVTDEKQLKVGEKVWRKTPTGVEENYYHSEEEFLVSLRNAGLTVEEIKRPCFGELRWQMHRSSLKNGEQGLGKAYIDNHPFTLYYIVKNG